MRQLGLAHIKIRDGKQKTNLYGEPMSQTKAPVRLSRDLEVVQIPEGYQVRLARGTEVRVMQALGDTYTVMTEYGTMVRIAGKDAEAIGEVLKTDDAHVADVAGSADETLTP